MKVYLLDSMFCLFGEAEVNPMDALPRCTTKQPPNYTPPQIPQFLGDSWIVLESYPAPQVAVPAAVTMRQARLALLGAGLLDDIDTAINALAGPQKEAARIEWEYSQEVQRYNGFVSILAPSLGLSEAQIDNLFIQASTL